MYVPLLISCLSSQSKDLQAANQHLFAKQEELNKAKKKLEEAKESDISQQTLQGMTEVGPIFTVSEPLCDKLLFSHFRRLNVSKTSLLSGE